MSLDQHLSSVTTCMVHTIEFTLYICRDIDQQLPMIHVQGYRTPYVQTNSQGTIAYTCTRLQNTHVQNNSQGGNCLHVQGYRTPMYKIIHRGNCLHVQGYRTPMYKIIHRGQLPIHTCTRLQNTYVQNNSQGPITYMYKATEHLCTK